MRIRLFTFALAAVLGVVCLSSTALAQTKSVGVSPREPGRRLGLVIGNGEYREATRLANPVNDARAMAAALEAVGFRVTLLTDAEHRRMEEAIDAFGLALKPEDVGLFYYSGHGVQVRGENYLIPVDANPKRATVLKFEAVNAARVLGMMEAAGNRLNLVILDACRNNPFKGLSRSLDPGLARMDAPSGTLLAYATAPGQVAEDGAGRNSPYTAALLRHLPTPGLRVEDVFKRVRSDVERATRKAQTPWEATSLTGDFYFAGGASVAAAPVPAPAPPAPSPDSAPAPPRSGFSLSDLEAEAKQEARRLEEMQQAFGQAQAFEQRPVAPVLKMAAWKRFLAAFERDNLYSGEDDRLRGDAEARIAHWTAEQERAERRPRVAGEVRSHIQARRLGEAQRILEREADVLGEPLQAALRSELETARVWREPITGMELVFIPSGSYEQGCHAQAGECYDDEKPARRVTLSPFWLGRTEVTQAQWKRIMGSNPSHFKGDDRPVEQVSWDDVQDYINRLNAQSRGATFRLPTEAEWEYACRAAGNPVAYGNQSGQLSPNLARYDSPPGTVSVGRYPTNSADPLPLLLASWVGTVSVGRYPPNALGLHDMTGNVWEWTQDVFDANAYRSGSASDPVNELSGAYRVLRGGGWSSVPRSARCSIRGWYHPGNRFYDLGFRLARTG